MGSGWGSAAAFICSSSVWSVFCSSGWKATRCTSFSPAYALSHTAWTPRLSTWARERGPRKMPAESKENPMYSMPPSWAAAMDWA